MKKLLTITAKDFLTGIGQGAEIGSGLFYKATGITPLFEAGKDQSPNNGLLMAGAGATTVSGSLGGNIIASTQFTSSTETTAYFSAADSHIYSLVLNSTISNSLASAHTAASLRHGLEVFRSSNGGNVLFYFMDTAIGQSNLSGSWNDSWKTGISSDDIHATHLAFDRLYFGNGANIGVLFDDGAGLATTSASNTNVSAFSIARYGNCTDISDDGLFLIIATTKNYTNDPSVEAGCNILFWDTYSPLTSRVYEIPDPFIFSLEKTSKGVFAIGTTGIWQVGYGFEPQKVFSRTPGIYSNQTSLTLKYGHGATSAYSDALLWGGASGSNYAVKTYGKLQSDAPFAYLEPFKTTANKNITFVDGLLLKGWVFVGDDTPALTAYPFSTTNAPQTSVTAQTAYIPLDGRYTIGRIDVVFGEPLASGDTLTMGVYTDEDTAVVSYNSVSYDANNTKRRHSFYPNTPAICEGQISLYHSFDAGAVKIKSVEVYGQPQNI